MRPTVYLSLGSNLGPRKEQLQQAIELLGGHPAIRVLQGSSVYETKPYGPVEQPLFWNLCLKLEVDERTLRKNITENIAENTVRRRCAELLLEYCQICEKQLGRDRNAPSVHWGPRSMDIDIIAYERLKWCSQTLNLPHPQFLQRLFVLVPLAEITDPDFSRAYSLRQKIQHLEAQDPDWGYKIACPGL